MNQQAEQYSDEEKEFLDTLIMSDLVYDSVISQLKIDQNDELYKNLVLGMLKRQTKDHLVFAIWNNLDENQLSHLKDFINQTAVTAHWMKQEDMLMEFALMYPDLKEKIFQSLNEFFKKFIQKFNELSEA